MSAERTSPDLSPAGLAGLREKAERAEAAVPGAWSRGETRTYAIYGPPLYPDGNRQLRNLVAAVEHWEGELEPKTDEAAQLADYIAAADPATVLALLAAVAELREALQPFADYANHLEENRHPDEMGCGYYRDPNVTVGDFRRAAAVLTGKGSP